MGLASWRRWEEWTWGSGEGCRQQDHHSHFLSFSFSTWEQHVRNSYSVLNVACLDHILMKWLHVQPLRCAENIHFTAQNFSVSTYSWQLVTSNGFRSRKHSIVHLEAGWPMPGPHPSPAQCPSSGKLCISEDSPTRPGLSTFTRKGRNDSQIMTQKLSSALLFLGAFI